MAGVKDHAARRAAKLAAQQAPLPPEKRLLNDTNLDKHVSKPVSVLTRQARKNSRDAFIATMSDPNVGRFSDVQAAEAMFQVSGRPFTCNMLRLFLEASAISRGGTVLDDVQSTRSLRLLIANLFGAAEAAGNPVDVEVKKNTVLWIDGELLGRGLAHRIARKKPVVLPQDVTAFIMRLFDPQFMCSLPTTRDPLLIVLFTCLHIDCGGRTSEFLRPSMSAENLKAYMREHPEKCFAWENVELFAYPPLAEGLSIELRGRLTFSSIKDSGHKGYKNKTIPIRLLPPHYAPEDSLFWLFTLGLIDQVFDGISKWSDLNRLQPGANGIRIRIKDGMKRMPVFRTANRAMTKASDPLINTEQMDAQTMNEFLHDLSRFCGLEHSILPNVLRRGSAYMLASTTSEAERAARMGHSDKDQTYWNSYRNTVSTVDFQGLRHGMEEDKSIATMASVFAGQSSSHTPPQTVSQAGMEAVHQDAKLRELLAQQTTILDDLLTAHGSLADARAADVKRYDEYAQLGDQYSKRKSHLVEKKYKEEYKQFFADARQPASNFRPPTLPQGSADRGDVEKLVADNDDSLDDVQTEPLPEQEQAGGQTLANTLLQQKQISDQTTVDPQLLANLADVANAYTYGDPADSSSSSTSSRKSTSESTRSFGTRTIGRHSLVDDVPKVLYGQPAEGTDHAELSDFFRDAFNHLHAADKFYPGQEPFAGTFDCRFCSEHLVDIWDERGVGSAHLHADSCEASLLANSLLDDVQPEDSSDITTCPLSDSAPEGPCKSKLKTPVAYQRHTSGYHCDSAKRWICSSHATDLLFDVQQDLFMHAVVVHGAPLKTIMETKTPSGKVVTATFIYFCPFCQVYIPRREELETDHLAGHLQDFANAISTTGLVGVWMFNHWAHPAFCPFCAYDVALPLTTRMHQFGDSKYLLAHIAWHLKKLETPVSCPVTATTPEGLPQCDETALLDDVQMAAHLLDEHGLDLTKAAKPPKPKSKSTTEPVDSEEPKRKKAKRQPLGELDVNAGSQLREVGEEAEKAE